MSKGVTKDKAEEIFELILKFGGYGFNKSHSTRYAIVAFQTAYMKVYHPVEYMAALLTFEMGDTTKMVEYIEECRRMSVKVLPPDVNVSDKDFTPSTKQRASGRSKTARSASACVRCAAWVKKRLKESSISATRAGNSRACTISASASICGRCSDSTIEALVKCGAFSSMSEKTRAAAARAGSRRGNGPAAPAGHPIRPDEFLRRRAGDRARGQPDDGKRPSRRRRIGPARIC